MVGHAGRQHDEIDAVNRRGDGCRVLKGVEADILADGSLDYGPDVLDRFDFVIGSIHTRFGMTADEMTERLLRSMEDPRLTILGHPTGRLLLTRDPYPLDLDRVLAAAAERGVAIEVNADPHRLDLDWRWWPLAKQKGVKCVINPDAHRTERLQDLWFGIGIARKGWLTKQDVVNCLPLEKIEKTLQTKRGR